MASTEVVALNEEFRQEITLPASGIIKTSVITPPQTGWRNVLNVTSASIFGQIDRLVIEKVTGTWDVSNYAVLDAQIRTVPMVQSPNTWDESDPNGDGPDSIGYATVHASKPFALLSTLDASNPLRFRFVFLPGAPETIFDPLMFWALRLRSHGTASTTKFRVTGRLNLYATYR